MNIENILNKAEVYYQDSAFSKAIELCNKVLLKKPKLVQARQILALCYQGINDISRAEKEFELALLTAPNNPNILNNFGQLYINSKNFKTASLYFKKAIRADSTFAAAYNNLSICQQQFRDFQEAEESIKKAILYDGTCADFYLNLGTLLTETGDFESSLSALMKSLELDPSQGNIYYHISSLMMYMHRYQDALEVSDIGIVSSYLSDIQLCELLVTKAILFWLFDNIEEAAQAIQLSRGIYSDRSNYSNIQSLTIFHQYLDKLVQFKVQNCSLYSVDENVKPIYFVSESHGFAPAGMKINHRDQEYVINSLFVRGAKVFHFGEERHNKFKESVLRLFRGLTPQSKVVLGFGEIDCRNNEGIFKYCVRYDKNYKEIIDDMVTKYLSFIFEHSQNNSLEIYIYGVPAPHINNLSILNEQEASSFKEIIRYFNAAMKVSCKHYNFEFLDVYELTNNNGISNMKYHIDNFHLTPYVTPLLFG